MSPSLPRRLLSHRLVQFACLAVPLFALAPRPPVRERIDVSPNALRALRDVEALRQGVADGGRLDLDAALSRLLADEVLYREALRLGLDQGDDVVRRRLIQKVRLGAEDEAGATRPATPAELHAFYDATRERWHRPATLRFIHVYVAADRRAQLEALRPRVEAEERRVPGVAPALGQPLGLPRDVPLTEAARVAALYGEDFARALEALRPGVWSEPLASRYGWHLVKVLERREGGPASYEELQPRLAFELALWRKQHAVDSLLARALPRYRVEVEGQPFVAPRPRLTVAVPSLEHP